MAKSRPQPVDEPHVTLVMFRHGGTRLLKPLVKLLTDLPVVEPGKLPYPDHVPIGPVVIFWRDPRDRIVSMYRWTLGRGGKKARRLLDLGRDDDARLAAMLTMKRLIDAMRDFAAHWSLKAGHRLQYEALRSLGSGPAEAERLAAYLGRPDRGAAAYASVIENTHGWNGQVPSRWDEMAGPLANEAWRRNGGPGLAALMGYPA